MIDKLLYNIDFCVPSETIKTKNSVTDLWKINHSINTNGNDTELMKQWLKKWKCLLEEISVEAFRKNVFLVSIRANQCLEYLKLITSE